MKLQNILNKFSEFQKYPTLTRERNNPVSTAVLYHFTIQLYRFVVSLIDKLLEITVKISLNLVLYTLHKLYITSSTFEVS